MSRYQRFCAALEVVPLCIFPWVRAAVAFSLLIESALCGLLWYWGVPGQWHECLWKVIAAWAVIAPNWENKEA